MSVQFKKMLITYKFLKKLQNEYAHNNGEAQN